MADRLNVFIPVASRFIRPQNTDWRYTAQSLPQALSRHCPELEVTAQRNAYVDATANIGKAVSMARSKGLRFIPHWFSYSLENDCPIFKSDISRSKAQVIFSYERYPASTFGLPVAWITSPSFPEIMEKQGYPAAEIRRILEWKRSRAERPQKLIFNTKVALDSFMLQNGEQFRSKSTVVPCLIPDLSALENADQKWQTDPLRFIFIGRQGIRKGLPVTVQAMTPLLKANPDISLTIVSNMADGPVEIPQLDNLKVVQDISRAELFRLTSEAHFLLLPSWFENYGFVYIEAMSQGCVPLALDNPVQRELIGECGILLKSQDADEMTQTLAQAIQARDEYRRKAMIGLHNFKTRHAPAVVASLFSGAIRDAHCRAPEYLVHGV
jgi:glycosyltransferase involved in cell wall biosynthesis